MLYFVGMRDEGEDAEKGSRSGRKGSTREEPSRNESLVLIRLASLLRVLRWRRTQDPDAWGRLAP